MKNTHQKNKNKKHDPVLLEAVLRYLSPQPGDSYLDVTAGYGGHAEAILDRTLSPSLATLIDRDNESIEELNDKFRNLGTRIIHGDYLRISEELLNARETFDIIFADLGVSSPHLNDASRGFSFKSDGPLDMRMDKSQSLTASKVVNSYKASDLAFIIKNYGEEPKAWQIARLIEKNRPVRGTEQLASIIKQAWPGHSKVHPATKTFQAIRIVVNDELNQLKRALPIWVDLLKPGGRLGIISFHSLEDRIVKNYFRELSGDRYDAVLEILNKRPIEVDPTELVINPRARSAKLRAVVKINKERGK